MQKLPLINPAFCQLAAGFREWLAVLGYAESSVYYLPHHVREFLYYLQQHAVQQVSDIQAQHVTAFFFQLKKRKHQRKGRQPCPGLSTAYLNKYLQALRLLSKYVRQTRQGYFTVGLHNQKAAKVMPAVLTQAEVNQLYQACDTTTIGLRDRAMLSLLYGCGLRRQEAVVWTQKMCCLPADCSMCEKARTTGNAMYLSMKRSSLT